MSAKCYDKGFKYTPVQEQGKDYLKKKFDAIRRAQKPRMAVASATVTQFSKSARGK